MWDDPAVDWAAAELVAVRSTWDYHRRTAEFLAWARAVESRTRLLNGAELFAWNADKAYLVGLADDVPCVPTVLLDDRTLVTGLAEAAERWGTVVIKPRVGASGIGVVVVTGPEDERLQMLAPAPWVVQPLVESVRTVGETSVYVFGGRAVSQVDKRAGGRRRSGSTRRTAAARSPCPSTPRGPRWPRPRSPRSGARRAGAGVRPGRRDALGGRVGGQRARADRARALPRHRPGNAEPFAELVVARCCDTTR